MQLTQWTLVNSSTLPTYKRLLRNTLSVLDLALPPCLSHHAPVLARQFVKRDACWGNLSGEMHVMLKPAILNNTWWVWVGQPITRDDNCTEHLTHGIVLVMLVGHVTLGINQDFTCHLCNMWPGLIHLASVLVNWKVSQDAPCLL